jgi:hypothetical protein
LYGTLRPSWRDANVGPTSKPDNHVTALFDPQPNSMQVQEADINHQSYRAILGITWMDLWRSLCWQSRLAQTLEKVIRVLWVLEHHNALGRTVDFVRRLDAQNFGNLPIRLLGLAHLRVGGG